MAATFKKVEAAVLQSFSENSHAFYVLASSVVVLIAAGINCTDSSNCTSYNGWAVAAAAVSTGFTFFFALIAMARPGVAAKAAPGLSIFLALWWIPGAFVLTFKAPFLIVGNGYYGAWLSFLFSLIWATTSGLPAIFGRREEPLAAEPGPVSSV